jgi:hypothetical protein
MPFTAIRLALPFLAWWACVGMPGPAFALEATGTQQQASPFRDEQSGPESYIVSFGLFGDQSVFESEARGAARILAEWLGAKAAPIVNFNNKRGGAATKQTLAAALRATGAAMDLAHGVLVAVLTSHGSSEGLAVVAGRTTETLTAPELRSMLDASSARYRVVIISACYSGVFVPALADPRTLVITAAAADRPSFGCEDGAKWTYFGEAFFSRALRTAPDLESAFKKAQTLVTARERREGFEPSNPQIAGGDEVLALLARRARPARSGVSN